MKFGIVFFGFSSFFLTPLFAQQSVNLIELEKASYLDEGFFLDVWISGWELIKSVSKLY